MITFRNPFIMAPVKLGYTNGDGKVNEKHLTFYNLRSKHIGAVELEPLYIHKGLRELPTQLGIDADDKIDGLKQIVDLLHKNGAKAGAHLNHPGRMANPKLPGNFYVSASEKACELGGPMPKALDKEGIQEAIQLVVDAAVRAEKAGFDFVELQMGHGYLVAQFLSPSVNSRTDEYGGSFENRSRFGIELLDAVKAHVNIPVFVRMSGDELIESGFHIDEMITFASTLKTHGAEAVQVLAGTLCNTPPFFFQHMFTPKGKTWELAKVIKEKAEIPTVFVGRINSATDIETVKSMGADFVAVGRALVADPDFIGKYLGEISDPIRPCLSCAEGCLGGVRSGKGLQCIVNPFVGTELKQNEQSLTEQKYAVVGGGVAGMETALQLSKRGASVDLFEKNSLGGQFNLAWLPPQKASLKQLIDYYKVALEDNNQIKIIYKEVQKNDLQNYDAVFMATGSEPVVPPIEGLKEHYWAEILHDENLPNAEEKILIIGGGLIGMEIASKLADNGNEVIVVEMLEEVARGMELIEKTMTLKKLSAKGVKIYTNYKVVKIDSNEVWLEDNSHQQQKITGIHKVVVAAGMKSYKPWNMDLPITSYFVGDVALVGNVQSAIYGVASQLEKIKD